MSPTDPLNNLSREKLRILLENDFILEAVKEEAWPREDWEVVRAIALLQQGVEPGSPELREFGVCTSADADLIRSIMARAEELMGTKGASA